MSHKLLYILVAVTMLVLIGAWAWRNAPVSNAPVSGPQRSDTTAAINEDLNAITVQDADFTDIDSDLNSL